MCHILTFLVMTVLISTVAPQSPCPTNVYRRSSDQLGKWQGELILRTEFTLSGVWVRLLFDKKVQLVGSTFEASISSSDNTEFVFSAPDFILDSSTTITIPFFVRFSELEAPPEVRAIFLNGRPLCPTGDVSPVVRISPCPNIFLYDVRQDMDRWYGNLTLRSDVELRGVWIKVTLDSPAQLIGSKFGSVKASDNAQFMIIQEDHIMKPGKILNIPIFVRYSILSPVPTVKSVRLNARTVCGTLAQETNLEPSNRTTLSIPPGPEKTVLPKPEPEPESESDDRLDSAPFFTAPVNAAEPPQNANFVLPKFRCGITELGDRIFFGRPATIQQYPWHGAIFHSTSYACGMSLISPYHAVSAAHCFYNVFEQPVDLTSINLYFGLSNLRDLQSRDIQVLKVANLFKHPSYEYHIPKYDIAVVKFNKLVNFNSKIQPICLWQQDPDLKTVENKSGVIVGFGLTEIGTRSNQLLWGQILVVDRETCREVDPSFYVSLSRFSYCAGNLSSSTVCRGDSGGGMYFQKPGTDIWQLRGITSTSKRDRQGLSCDNTRYAIFTDVARYKGWVQEQMKK